MAFQEFSQAVFKDGALPNRTKQLIAIGVAHVTQCPWCISGHTTCREGDGDHRGGDSRGDIRRYGDARWCGVHARFDRDGGRRRPSALAGWGKTIFQRISNRQDSLYMSILYICIVAKPGCSRVFPQPARQTRSR
jgi:hypothetical protein